jgi:two-component system, NtrC family, sensor kinase
MNFQEEQACFFNYAKEMLCIASFEGYFLHLNPMFEKTLGWSNTELKKKLFIEFVHPNDRKNTLNAIRDLGDGNDI